MILETVQSFLLKASQGKASLSPELVEEFGQACSKALDRQFNDKGREWKIRPSGLGKAVCQQQLDKAASDKGEEVLTDDYTRLFKFLMGDLIEAYALAVMKGAGLPVEDEQKKVNIRIGEQEVGGTLDMSLFGKTYDIKSASDFSSLKFGEFGGYEVLKKDDPFGYVIQGHIYGAASGSPFGGWIAVNKSNGSWMVCEAPEYLQREEEAEALEKAEANIETVLNAPFKKLFEDYPEDIKEKGKVVGQTGNRRLAKECGFCDHKRSCWPKCEVHRDVVSKRARASFVWYSKLVKKEVGNE